MSDSKARPRIVVVTGGAVSPGIAIVRRFAAEGAHVILADANTEHGMQAARSLQDDGLDVSFEPLDVTVSSQCAAFVGRIVAAHGQLDVWVNGTDLMQLAPAEALTPEQWAGSINFLVSGAFYCAQAAGRQMLAQGHGVIVNLTTVDAFKAREGYAAYATAQAGVVMLTQALGIEWAARGVRVVGVAAGPLEGDAGPWQDMNLQRTPLHRLGQPADLAEAVFFVASDQASSITAETLRVDGGWVAYQFF